MTSILALACAVFGVSTAVAAPAIREPMAFDRAIDMLRARKNVPEAVAALEAHARRGYGRASLLLGTLMLEGKLVPTNEPLGLAFVRLGAETNDPAFNASVRKKVTDLVRQYESSMSGADLIESDRLLGQILRDINGYLLEYIGDDLDAVTDAKPVAISPTIRFDQEPVRIRLPEKVGTYARVGCAADPDPACPSASPPRDQGHCTGEIVHADATWSPGPAPYTVRPKYPYEARQLWISGTVAVAAHVDSSGLLCSGVVVRIPAGNAGPLADAALDAMRCWQLDPAMRDGRPVESLRLLAINFVLD